MLSGGVLSTVFIPDTEEVTGSIPVSPTSTKRPLNRSYAVRVRCNPGGCAICVRQNDRDAQPLARASSCILARSERARRASTSRRSRVQHLSSLNHDAARPGGVSGHACLVTGSISGCTLHGVDTYLLPWASADRVVGYGVCFWRGVGARCAER